MTDRLRGDALRDRLVELGKAHSQYKSCRGHDGRVMRIGDEVEFARPLIGARPTEFPFRGTLIEVQRHDVFILTVHSPAEAGLNATVRAPNARKVRG
jgi:hypothetical protein